MDNKCFISKLLKGFVVMSIHVTYGIKRKETILTRLAAEPADQDNTKATVQQEAQCSPNAMALQGRESNERIYGARLPLLWKPQSVKSWRMGCSASASFSSSLELYLRSRGPIKRQNKPSHPPATPPVVRQGNPSQGRWHLNSFRSLVFCEVAMS